MPSEVEQRGDGAKPDMENALCANPLGIEDQYERQLKAWQEACSEAMLKLRARKKRQAQLDELGSFPCLV